MQNSLKDKTIFITGASSGIGRETAYKFAAEGARLALTYFGNEKEADAVVEKCKELGAADVLMTQLDIRNTESIQDAVRKIIDKFGEIDVLINNAGIRYKGPFIEESFQSIENQVRINVEGLIKVTKECLSHIKQSIINIASEAGMNPHANSATYNATKFAVRGFTKTLALEYPNLNIFAVNPDKAATAMTDYEGRPPEEVAQVILDTTKGKYNVPNGGDINVWEVL